MRFDMVTFADYLSSTIRVFIQSVYNGISLNFAGTTITLAQILLSGIIFVGLTTLIAVIVNRG